MKFIAAVVAVALGRAGTMGDKSIDIAV